MRPERICWLISDTESLHTLTIVEKGYELVFFGIWTDKIMIHFSSFRILEKFYSESEKEVFSSSSLISHFYLSSS
jgi:hypothetical protein